MTDHDQLEENLRAMAEPFTPKDERMLTAQLAAISRNYCRMCGAGGGVCEKGIPVSDVLRFLTYARATLNLPWGARSFWVLARMSELCGAPIASCSIQCPHGVEVAARLSQAQELYA